MNARATVRNPEMAALLEQYTARFNARQDAALAARYAPTEQWTPKAVGEAMLEALRWAQWSAGRTGPGGVKTVSLPFIASLDEHLAEGWGLPEVAGDDDPDPRRLRFMPSPEQISRHEGDAQILVLWSQRKIACKPFDAEGG